MMNTNRPRVLLVAHHANPELTSEPLIGWRWASQLDTVVDLRLVTHCRNRKAIERIGGLRRPVHYIETERMARTVNRLNDLLWPPEVVARSFLESLSLSAFDRQATQLARKLAASGEIDLIHRVSPISPRASTRLGTVGVPFILGPINGGMEMAPGFGNLARVERSWPMAARRLARLLDLPQTTFRKAAAILVATETTRSIVPEQFHGKTTLLCENGVNVDHIQPRFERSGGPLSILFVGRLIPYKGVAYLLRAMAGLPARVSATLDIVGTGPQRPELVRLIRGLGLNDRVVFRGAVANDKVSSWMARADVLCLPSLRESGGAVVLEAMAAGTPTIVADHGGPAETVNDDVGFRVPAYSPDILIAGIRDALLTLARDESRREAMGRAARAHVERGYTWRAKAGSVQEIYEMAIRESGDTSFHRRPHRQPLQSNVRWEPAA